MQFKMLLICIIFLSCSPKSEEVITFYEYYSLISSGGSFSDGPIVILNADGCSGCMDSILKVLAKSECEYFHEIIFITKFKKEVSEYVARLPNKKILYDSDGKFYGLLKEPMKSLHYYVSIDNKEINKIPITPQNLNDIILKIEMCS